MADVFISYSRKDTDFVRRLHEALATGERDTWVDWEDIPLTAEWWSEIQEGIDSADTFVFILSPDSARSKVCFDEVEYAYQNNKRIVPILRREVTDAADKAQMHWAITRHNWIYMRDEDDFDAAFENLITALNTDLAHVKQHTALLLRARNWDRTGRLPSPLLRGSDFAARGLAVYRRAKRDVACLAAIRPASSQVLCDARLPVRWGPRLPCAAYGCVRKAWRASCLSPPAWRPGCANPLWPATAPGAPL